MTQHKPRSDRAIPPDLEPEVLRKYGEGWHSRRIAEWLKTEHGVECSHASVARIVKRTRTERADVAKEVVREKLSRTLTSDLDILTELRDEVRAVSLRLHKALSAPASEEELADPLVAVQAAAARAAIGDLYLKAVDRVAKVIDLKLHYSGADTPDETMNDIARADERLAGRLDSLATRLRAGEGAPRDSADPAGESGP